MRRNKEGWIIHDTLLDWTIDQDLSNNNTIQVLPVRVTEDNGTGTEIQLREDQVGVLYYWAQAQQTAQVGISVITDGGLQVEYWIPLHLDPIADQPIEEY
jgi:hypothetical protein